MNTIPILKLRKIGNSLGVIFPKDIVKEKNLKEDDVIVVTVAKKANLEKIFGSFKTQESTQKIKDELRKGWK